MRAEKEAAATGNADLIAKAIEATERISGGDLLPIEQQAMEFVRKMQMSGSPYECTLVALETWTGLSHPSRLAVIDNAYAVGKALSRETDDDYYRPDVGSMIPEIDIDDLFGDAPIIARRVREVAAGALVTPCMPAIAALAIASFACAARVKGFARNLDGSPWRMFPNLYLGVEAVSGGKKSYVRKLMGGELLTKYEEELRTRYHAQKEKDEYERSIANGRIARQRAAEIAGKPPDAVALADAHERLARPSVCVPDYILAIPNSVEWYVSTLRASGFCALMPDEGKEAIKIFVSGKDGNENCGPLLSAHTVEIFQHGSHAATSRGDDNLPFNVLCGGAYLPFQPSVLTPMSAQEALMLAAIQGRGLLARLLVARPRLLAVPERVALRAKIARGETNTGAEIGYTEFMSRLVHGEHGDHPLAPSTPCLLHYTEDANKAWQAFQAEAEDSAAPGGRHYNSPGSEFVRRQADHLVRIAALLAVLRDGTIRDGTVEKIDVERAIRIMSNYFLPHALAVARRTVYDPVGNDADVVWQHVAGVGTVRKRDLQQRLGAGWGKARPGDRQSRIDAALEELAERGRVIMMDGDRKTRLIRVVGRCL